MQLNQKWSLAIHLPTNIYIYGFMTINSLDIYSCSKYPELYRELAEGQSPKVMFNLLVYNQ